MQQRGGTCLIKQLSHVVLFSAWCLAGAIAYGQTTPEGGAAQELQRQQERERVLRQQLETQPDVRREVSQTPARRLPADESPCFHIERITLEGQSSEVFQWALAAADPADDPATGRCLGSAGVNLVMTRVQNAIIGRGYVTTRILAAPQDLKQGTLALTVIPGRIRAIRFTKDSSARATLWNAVPAHVGDLLNLRDIEQALENFKRVPTADADIQIVPADGPDAQPGQSDLVITWKQQRAWRLATLLDNSGSQHTGKYQGSFTFSYDDPFDFNDLFYVSLNHDLGDSSKKGTFGYTVHYDVPYGYWLFGLTTSYYKYDQTVVGATENYIYSGTSQDSEVRLSRLLYRNAVRKIGAYLRGWQRSSSNAIDDTEIGVQRRRMAGWEVGLTEREFIGTATLDANLAYRHGTGMLSSLAAPEQAFGEGTARPIIITADTQLAIPFEIWGQQLRYTGAWRAQWNRTPLVPLDRFSIGNRYTVRGFDGEATLMGDRGWLVRNDLGWRLGQTGLELYLGLDWGAVGGPSTQLLAGQHLAGAGLGLRGGGYKGLTWDVFIGKPLSKPENLRTANVTGYLSLNWSY